MYVCIPNTKKQKKKKKKEEEEEEEETRRRSKEQRLKSRAQFWKFRDIRRLVL